MKTTDYNQFKLVKTNRPISKCHVDKLIKSIKSYGYFNSKPITVNKFMEISDGQHRFMACKELNIPIHYEIDDMNVNESMVILNTTSNIWRLDEFINHYAENGIFCYIELRNLINQTNYGTSNCIVIYSGSMGGVTRQIRAGVTIKKYSKITELIELIEFFKGKLKFCLNSQFIKSLVALLNLKEITDKHLDRLKLNTYAIQQCATTEQYLIQYKKLMKLKQ